MKPRKSISIYVLLVGVMGLLIVGGIFSFQIIDEATKNQLPASQRELVKALDGKIENEILEDLKQRRVFSREELINLPSVTPTTVQITITSEASSSSQSGIPTP